MFLKFVEGHPKTEDKEKLKGLNTGVVLFDLGKFLIKGPCTRFEVKHMLNN